MKIAVKIGRLKKVKQTEIFFLLPCLVLIWMISLTSPVVQAQATKTLNVLVPFAAGGTVDIKALIMPETSTAENIDELIAYTSDVNARMLYIRAVVNDMGKGSIHSIDKDLITYAISEGKSKDLKVKVNQRAITSYKSYSKCHALYLMPIFSATGGIYLCPENRGNEQLSLCNWITDDWREIWSSKHHNDIYNNFSLDKCISCRPDQHNVAIDNMLKSKNIEELFF
jgi:hypothetical protein